MEESIVFIFPYQANGSHATEPSRVGHVITERHWKSTSDFNEIVNSMPNCEIHFPILSETIHTILKIFSQHGLRKYRWRLLQKKKKESVKFFAKSFG